jgi:hypothetical protein
MSKLIKYSEYDLYGVEPDNLSNAKVQNPSNSKSYSDNQLIRPVDDAKRNALLMNSVSNINQAMKDSFHEDPTKKVFTANFRAILTSLRERMKLILDELDPEIQLLKNGEDKILSSHHLINKKMQQAEEIGLQIQNIERILKESTSHKKLKNNNN